MPASLRGASAEAAAALVEELDGVAAGELATVADELFEVADTLRAEGALRRFLTDGSVPEEARRGLAQDVLGSKLAAGTAGLVVSAVGRRWTATRDLALALEHLGVVAHATAAGSDSGRLVDELFAVGQLVKDNPELRDALADPARSSADKDGLVDTLLSRTALPATVALTKQSLAGTHRTVLAALEEYEKVAAEVHGQGVATVRTARALSDAEEQRLAAALEQQYQRPVHLNILVDPGVLGGLRVEIGDDVIDGTISSRLDDARRRIAG